MHGEGSNQRLIGLARCHRKSVIENGAHTPSITPRQLRCDSFQGGLGDNVQLIPNVLASEGGGLESKQMRPRGALRPLRPTALGARPDGAVQGCEQQRGPDGKRATGVRQGTINERPEAQTLGHGFECCDIAMLGRAYAEGRVQMVRVGAATADRPDPHGAPVRAEVCH